MAGAASRVAAIAVSVVRITGLEVEEAEVLGEFIPGHGDRGADQPHDAWLLGSV